MADRVRGIGEMRRRLKELPRRQRFNELRLPLIDQALEIWERALRSRLIYDSENARGWPENQSGARIGAIERGAFIAGRLAEMLLALH